MTIILIFEAFCGIHKPGTSLLYRSHSDQQMFSKRVFDSGGLGTPKAGSPDTPRGSLPSIMAPQGNTLHRLWGEGASFWESAPGCLLPSTPPGAVPGPHLSWPLREVRAIDIKVMFPPHSAGQV